MRTEGHRLGRRRVAELGGGLDAGPDRSDADVLPVEEGEPLGELALAEDRGERRCERVLIVVELALGELRETDQRHESIEELRLEGGDGESAAVGGLVRAVAGEAARQHLRQRDPHSCDAPRGRAIGASSRS